MHNGGHNLEVEEEPEHPRPGSLRKRRIVLITRPNEHE
jgi:hypothetical protein